jgi:hypothetical protein
MIAHSFQSDRGGWFKDRAGSEIEMLSLGRGGLFDRYDSGYDCDRVLRRGTWFDMGGRGC